MTYTPEDQDILLQIMSLRKSAPAIGIRGIALELHRAQPDWRVNAKVVRKILRAYEEEETWEKPRCGEEDGIFYYHDEAARKSGGGKRECRHRVRGATPSAAAVNDENAPPPSATPPLSRCKDDADGGGSSAATRDDERAALDENPSGEAEADPDSWVVVSLASGNDPQTRCVSANGWECDIR